MDDKQERNAAQAVFGIIGWPLGHTLSSALHEAAYRKLGMNAVYSAFPTPPESLRDAVRDIRAKGLRGINVTVPHKVAVMSFLDEVAAAAAKIGAVNTIVRTADGRLVGHNTDAAGFVLSLAREGVSLAGRRVAVFGAGGAARAVVAAAAAEKAAEIRIFNRTLSRAKELADAFTAPERPVTAFPIDDARDGSADADVWVQTTSVGLSETDAPPVPLDHAAGKTLVDLIYRPRTAFLIEGGRRGAKVIDGYGMLVYQAAEAFRLWTGLEPPVEEMWSAGLAARK